jgi:diacylglycerol kinase (ATP)
VVERLINAWRNSVRAWRYLIRHERAFQQEIVILALAIPAGWFIAATWRGYAVLIGVLLFMIVVEVLNTGIEAACDAISREFNIDIQLAKDCGSLAVMLSIAASALVWGGAVLHRFWGLPV